MQSNRIWYNDGFQESEGDRRQGTEGVPGARPQELLYLAYYFQRLITRKEGEAKLRRIIDSSGIGIVELSKKMRAIHQGAFRVIHATGKHVVIKGVEIEKIGEGKLLEKWDFPDSMAMTIQLGVLPAAAPKT